MSTEHPLAYTNIELEGIFRKRIKRRIPKLWQFERKIYDTYAPKQYVKVMMFVPQPTLEAPLPCVLVMIATAHRSVFFRLTEPDALPGVLFLPTEELQKCHEALQDAKKQADDIERIVKHHLALKDRPDELKRALEEVEKIIRTGST